MLNLRPGGGKILTQSLRWAIHKGTCGPKEYGFVRGFGLEKGTIIFHHFWSERRHVFHSVLVLGILFPRNYFFRISIGKFVVPLKCLRTCLVTVIYWNCVLL